MEHHAGAVATPGSAVAGAQNYLKIFVSHKMTRNGTPNKVHVAATELPQLMLQNAATAQCHCQTLCSSKVN